MPTCHPQNRNIIAYRNGARGEPSHGHRNTHNLLMIGRVDIVPEICSWRQDTLVTILRSSNGILSHEMSSKDSRNHSCSTISPRTPKSRAQIYHLCQTGLRRIDLPYSFMWRGYQRALRHIRPCYAKSSFQSVDLQIQLGSVSLVIREPSGPISSAATTTTFP